MEKTRNSGEDSLTVGADSAEKRKRRRRLAWAATGAVLICLALLGVREYRGRSHLERQTRFMMDTYVTIYAVGPESETRPAIEAALDRMQEVDAKFSIRNAEGAIYAFNEQGTPITDPEILGVVQAALRITLDSEGVFDITAAPLIELWGFYDDAPRVPSGPEIDACLAHVGFEHLSLSVQDLRKDDPGVKIDLGGIAKGYAIGQAVEVLREQGIASALVDAGGDVYALGSRGGNPWKVGIKDPLGDGLLGYVEVEDTAVMGSGDYERFFEVDGRRYHHILNPRTGYPVAGLTGSVLVCADPMTADGWNTAVFASGPQKGLELVAGQPGMQALMVTETGDILTSDGIEELLFLQENRNLSTTQENKNG